MRKQSRIGWPGLLVLLLCFGVPAQEAKPTPKAALPDAATLLHQLQENQRQIDEIKKNYICTDDEEEYDLDKNGATRKKEVRQYEFYYVERFPIRKLLSKEGVPLDEHDRRKEDERVAKDEKKAHERQAKLDRGEQDKNRITMQTFLESSLFQNPRIEDYHGHEVIAMGFIPNPAFKPKGLGESVANKLGGTVWIDEQAHQIVRLEARLLNGQRVGLGLASVKEGTSVVLEQQRINDEVWMPSMSDANLEARIVFKGLRKRFVDHYSNYKKFKADTKIVGVEEVNPK